MNDLQRTSTNNVKSGRHVFRLGSSLRFAGPANRSSIFFTLRARLIATFLIIALIPTALLAYFYNNTTKAALTSAAEQALVSSANQTRDTFDTFMADHLYALNEKSSSQALLDYINAPTETQPGGFQERYALNFLATSYEEDYNLNNYIMAYVLMNKDGKILLDTSAEQPDQTTPYVGLNKADETSFNLLLQTGLPYISSVIFTSGPDTGVFYFVARITDENQQPAGLILARYNADLLQAFIDKNNDLAGSGSYAVLYDDNNLRLALGGVQEEYRFKTVVPLDSNRIAELQSNYRLPRLPAEQLSTNNPNLAEALNNSAEVSPFFTSQAGGTGNVLNTGVIVPLGNVSWKVAYLEPQSLFLSPIQEQARTTAALAAIIALGTLIVAFFVTQQLTRPITELTQVAQKVTTGDLRIQATETSDEIGVLGAAFNSMTTELRRTLEGLERRVGERTAELARATEQMKYRASQLQTVADVARAITSVSDLDLLLEQVTNLISQRFNFYHVGIFLLDNNGEFAVLQSANSEGGKRMLERGHKLGVGQTGMVGYVTSHGEPRIALDVGSDAVFFDNPDLPDTRSEMTLPLKVGDRIIGALDVQSTQPSDFKEDDISLIGTLADQVAVAIENVRLFSETRSALIELQALHSQYLEKEWSQVVSDRGSAGYQYSHGRLMPVQASETQDFWKSIEPGKPMVIPVSLDAESGSQQQGSTLGLVVPVTVRGQVIGVLNFADIQSGAEWSEDDINLVKEVADQVGLALENARLLEQTQKRADRERLVSNITTKLRSSNDPQVILQTAASELRNALRAKHAQVVLQPAQPLPAKNNNDEVSEDGHESDETTGEDIETQPA